MVYAAWDIPTNEYLSREWSTQHETFLLMNTLQRMVYAAWDIPTNEYFAENGLRSMRHSY